MHHLLLYRILRASCSVILTAAFTVFFINKLNSFLYCDLIAINMIKRLKFAGKENWLPGTET